MTNPIKQAQDELSGYQREKYSLDEFLEHARENPESVVDSVQYLVNAIEYFGTREIVERGEEKERYRFFDDPTNGGEHAVLGNTDELNSFVQSLKRKTREEGDNDKIIWFTGPTATGKSELKRCILNGIDAYARSDEGRRYTLEWSLDSLSDSSLTYNDQYEEEKDWYKSPVNVNPLSVLPEGTREDFVSSINTEFSIDVECNLDPFSREAYNYLDGKYDDFEDVVSSEHLRVVSYIPEMGDGVGILQSEDTGNVKQKMVGSWMKDAMNEFASRGRKNAQAFTYDGLLSQGNSSISLVEDSHHHIDLFQKLMNVCEENVVKLDNKIVMNIDTLIICLSNPDFERNLHQYEGELSEDPLKSLRRRLEKYDFNYLTSLLLETQLIRKDISNQSQLWEGDVDSQFEKAAEPLEVFDTHFSPHAIKAAAFYDVLSRLDTNSKVDETLLENVLKSNLSPRDKILFYDRGYHIEQNRKIDLDAEDIVSDSDGENGIPVTYTTEKLTELAQSDDYDVVMPGDVIDNISNGLKDDPLFAESETQSYTQLSSFARGYINDEMMKDVIEAMIDGNTPTEEDIREYVDSLFSWDEGEEDEYDPYELREFETSYLGINPDAYDGDAEPKKLVTGFRVEKILNPINKHIWDSKDSFEDIPLQESDTLEILLENNTWGRVEQLYDNIDIQQWRDPPSGSNTESLKQTTIDNMIEMGYTRQSAEKATIQVFKNTTPVFEGD